MSNILLAALGFSTLFVLMFVSALLGRYLGRWQLTHHVLEKLKILTVVEGAVFALLGLLIAFTFSGAYDRFEARKIHIIDEANAIETVFYRIDLLAQDTQEALRQSLKQYLDSEISIYQHISYINRDEEEITRSLQLRRQLWSQAVVACKKTNSTSATTLFISSVNNLFDIANTHFAINRVHPPFTIFGFLIVLAMLSSFLAGYSTAGTIKYNRIYIVIYVLITAMMLYLILDLEFPRIGLIRVNMFDHLLIEVRDTFYPKIDDSNAH